MWLTPKAWKLLGVVAVVQLSFTVLSTVLLHIIRSHESTEKRFQEVYAFLSRLKALNDQLQSFQDSAGSSGLGGGVSQHSQVINFYSNTFHSTLAVPHHCVTEEEARRLYCWSCLSGVSTEQTVDLWNLIWALIEFELNPDTERLCKMDAFSRADLLATAKLLKGKYRLSRFFRLADCKELVVSSIPHHAVQHGLLAFECSRWQLFSALLEFCTTYLSPAQWVLTSLLQRNLLSLFHGTFGDEVSMIVIPELSESCRFDPSSAIPKKSIFDLLKSTYERVASKVMFVNILITAIGEILSAWQQSMRQKVVQEVGNRISRVCFQALAVQDYTPDPLDALPFMVESALHACAVYAEVGVGTLLKNVANAAQDVLLLLAYPFPCAVAWLSTQFIRYAECRMIRLIPTINAVIRIYTGQRDGSTCASSPSCTDPSNHGIPYHRTVVECRHVGLSMLILSALSCAPSESWGLASFSLSTIFPSYNTSVIRALSLPLCEALLSRQAGFSAALDKAFEQGFKDYLKRLHTDLLCELDDCRMIDSVHLNSQLFRALHRAGIEPHKVHLSSNPSAHGFFNSLSAEDVVSEFLGRAEWVPVSLALTVMGEGESEKGVISSNTNPFSSISRMALVNDMQEFASRFCSLVKEEPLHYVECADVVDHDHFLEKMRFSTLCFRYQQKILKNLLKMVPTIDNKPWEECERLPSGAWKVEFINVSFRYPGGERYVLQNVSFKVESGQRLGIIGFSGAGKSTLLLLINRIYTPTCGQILLNDQPIECFSVRALRRRVAFAWQSGTNGPCFLSNITIESTVGLGDLFHGSGKKIKDALRVANCLKSMEQRGGGGLKSIMREHELSSGEKERLNIARAVLTAMSPNASVMMLDESFSALDSLTEERIWEGLESLWRKNARRPTMCLVTHRISSVQNCDWIIILAEGKVMEQGTWNSLSTSSSNTFFHTLLSSQKLHFDCS